jgi:myosin heavy subunit
MREILEFESWANSMLNEAGRDRPETLERDIQRQAQLKFPDRSPEQAMSLFVADKLTRQEKLDYEQNKIINSQKRENDKLRRSLQDLSNELHDHENQAQQTDVEVQRLKDLSAKLKPAGEIQQAVSKASADKVEAMLADLEKVKNNPKIDDRKFKEISDKVQQLQNTGSDKEVLKTQEALKALSNTQELGRAQYSDALDALEKSYAENIAKEKRFRASKKRNEEMKGSWGIKFADLNQKIKEIEEKAGTELTTLSDKLNQANEQLSQASEKLTTKINQIDQLDATTDQVQDQVERLYDLIAKVNNINPANSSFKIPPHPNKNQDAPLFDPNNNSAANDGINIPKNRDNIVNFDKEKKLNMPDRQTSKQTDTLPDQVNLSESDLQISFTDEEPQGYDNMIENAIDELMPWFAYKYPESMNKFPEDQIRKIMRRTIGAGLMIYGPSPTENEIYRFLERVALLLDREAERVRVQVPVTDPNQRKLNFQESLLYQFSKSLDRVTKI